MEKTEYWDGRAAEAQGSSANFCAFYSFLSCRAAILRGLSLTRQDAKVLKTDLWNEAIALERDVLQQLSHYPNLYGMDISRFVCSKAHGRLRRVVVSQADLTHLPFKPESFQAIIDLSTIDHVSEQQALHVIDDYCRLLSKRGILVLAYAQTSPFARQYWGDMRGVYLLSSALKDKVYGRFSVVEDSGLNILPLLLMLPPSRWIERLLWHLPKRYSFPFHRLIGQLEVALAKKLRSYIGMRLLIGVKQ